MRKNRPQSKSLKRQFLSGTVYVALAAVVAAVTINTTGGLLSSKAPIPEIPDFDEIKTEIPSVPDIPWASLPELKLPQLNSFDSKTVSDSPQGIVADITEGVETIPEEIMTPVTVPESEIPQDLNMGFDGFIKPCSGYVSKSFSLDIPVYSSTMSDYRTHHGVDVTGEAGDVVYVVCGGIVRDIYDDDLYGKTVVMETVGGYTVKYSNLLESLHASVSEGALLPTGTELGGIGKTAICEAVEPSHVHLEIYDSDGNAVDPEDLISF